MLNKKNGKETKREKKNSKARESATVYQRKICPTEHKTGKKVNNYAPNSSWFAKGKRKSKINMKLAKNSKIWKNAGKENKNNQPTEN